MRHWKDAFVCMAVEATEAAELSGCAGFCRMKRGAVTVWRQFADFLGTPCLHFRVVLARFSDPPACPRVEVGRKFRRNVNSHQNLRRHVPEDRIFNIPEVRVTHLARKPVTCEIF